MTIFLLLFCFASSIDSTDILLRVSTPTSDDSFLREKLWPVHQFKTTRAVTADHKELKKNRSWTEQWRIQDQFLSRGKSFWPQNQNEWTAWKTTKPLRYYTLSNTGKKWSQKVLENYTPSKMWRDFAMPGTESTHIFIEMVSLGLFFCSVC